MAIMPSKRSNILLYTAEHACINTHWIKLVASEKNIALEIINIKTGTDAYQHFLQINPAGVLPTLLDRDLTLDEPRVITEYLDERFPHPPLLPVYPIARAKIRLMIARIQKEWYPLARVKQLNHTKQSDVMHAQTRLLQSVLSFSPVFLTLPYFLSEEFSLLDCCIAPLIWELSLVEKNLFLLPAHQAIARYAKTIFDRPAFKASLSLGNQTNEYA